MSFYDKTKKNDEPNIQEIIIASSPVKKHEKYEPEESFINEYDDLAEIESNDWKLKNTVLD